MVKNKDPLKLRALTTEQSPFAFPGCILSCKPRLESPAYENKQNDRRLDHPHTARNRSDEMTKAQKIIIAALIVYGGGWVLLYILAKILH